MTKQLSPLEALEKIKQEKYADGKTIGEWLDNSCKIIETALKDYLVYEDVAKGYNLTREDILTAFALLSQMRSMGIGTPQVVNKLKAFEIIKEKLVFPHAFTNTIRMFGRENITYEYYKVHFVVFHNGYPSKLLTQEEFDLLKEELK